MSIMECHKRFQDYQLIHNDIVLSLKIFKDEYELLKHIHYLKISQAETDVYFKNKLDIPFKD